MRPRESIAALMTDRGLSGVAPKGAVGAVKRIGASRDVPLRPDDLAALPAFEVERLRVPAERRYAAALEKFVDFPRLRDKLSPPPPDALRRRLMAESLRLSESMAPDTYSFAHAARRTLRIDRPLEIYQSGGRENAAIHLIEEPIILEIRGRLMTLLDRGAAVAVFGHEFGHYLAHGPWTPLGHAGTVASVLLRHEGVPEALATTAGALSMAMELTADRFGLLACQDLGAQLRLEMICTTSLPGDALTWDTDAYLLQCRELIDALLEGEESAAGISHPEHSVRAWAAWLFSETAEYRALTGKGPGTRALADVDALIDRVLAQPSVDFDWHLFDAPPPEMHECALACSVLVAAADGDLADVEADAIERVFAPLVPDWRWYLDDGNARERLAEVAPVMSAAGADGHRALFLLLMHVVVADGKLFDSEIEMVLSVGEYLGAGPLFQRLMSASLRALGVTRTADEAPAPSIPLPPRGGEAMDALRAFLTGVVRRRGAQTTLRRMLRLVGATEPNPEALRALSGEIDRARITLDPGFEQGDQDTERTLTAPPTTAPAAPVRTARRDASLLPEERARLLRAVTSLRDELVSGNGRSPAVRLRAPRAGRAMDLHDLEALSTGLAERTVAQLREGRRARLVDAAEAGAHTSGQRLAASLLLIDRDARQRAEETGARDLAVGHPFLAGVVQGYMVRGPLVLHPVTLERDARGARGFALLPVKDEPPIVNLALLRLLFVKKGYAFTDALAESLDAAAADPARSVEAILETLTQVGLDAARPPSALAPLRDRSEEIAQWTGDRLELEESAVLGFFPQSDSDLLQDYDALLTALGDPAADPGAVLGCAAALLPPEMRAALQTDGRPSSMPPPPSDAPVGTVLYADPSQRAVLRRAATERALVIDGPPGTGKSQVIVNLVAEALARGERVAVVCEKRAALDVVAQRAQSVGLRHAMALVHDVFDDRKGLYAQLAARLEETTARSLDAPAAARVVQDSRRIEQFLGERGAALRQVAEGSELMAGQLHVLAAGIDAPALDLPEGLALVPERALEPLADALLALRPFADLYAPSARWASVQRPSYADLDARAVAELRDALSRALGAAQELESVAARSPVGPAELFSVRGALDEALALQPALVAAPSLLLPVTEGLARQPAALAIANEAIAAWRSQFELLARLSGRVEFGLSPDGQQALALVHGWAGRFGRFFVGAWWGARRALRESLLRAWPERSASGFDRAFLDELRMRVEATAAWRRLDHALESLGLGHARPSTAAAGADVLQGIEAALPLASRLAGLRAALLHARAWPDASAGLAGWASVLTERRAVLSLTEQARRSVAALGGRFPWLGAQPGSDALAATLQAWAKDGARLAEGDRAMAEAARHSPDAAGMLAAMTRTLGQSESNRWRDALVREWARARIARLERANRGLAERDQPTPWGTPDAAGQSLAKLYDQATGLEAQRVAARLDDIAVLRAVPAQKGRRRTADQATREAMLKESRKQRNVMPLRTFVRRFADSGLLDVLPVWLLSPETMTVLFPQEALFDLVVFDEASQCTVESGLPVLLRARRVLVVGDEKQMPPSSFFTSSATGDSDDEAPASRSARELLEAESLLSLARTRLDRVGLEWHYRCRHEELIAFSNHAMYEGELRTIPSTGSPAAPPSMRWVAVPDGGYDKGRNPAEALRVVEVIAELLGRPDAPSVGVVTFNLPQRGAVLDAVDARRAADPGFARTWDAAMAKERVDERPFVKNLESVQGDERDVIVFSTGHAPVERKVGNRPVERYVPARFGPLGQRGGERRLNVAISRARVECVVVASFEPSMLSVARAAYEGPRLFKAFLEFAWHVSHGRRPQAADVLARVRGAAPERRTSGPQPTVRGWLPLRVQVAAALQAMGLQVELDVGTSTARIPVAVIDPRDPGRYRLAVLCDEGDDATDAFERWVHRPRVLAMRGWSVLTVDARRWERRRQEVLAEIAAALA
jgi:RecA/RadA recombinase